MCPNCHSQTEGWCGSKGYAEVTSEARASKERRKLKRKNADVVELADTLDLGSSEVKTSCKFDPCRQHKPRPTKISWPSNEDLAKMLQEQSAVQVAKALGVSSGAIKKHCLKRDIETKPRGYWAVQEALKKTG